MSLFVDHNYIAQVGSRLERFKRKSQKLYNFRCPFCGDSTKSKTKARGYFYQKGNDMFYRCHNCLRGMTLATFLKEIDYSLYEQYIFDRYKNGENGHSNYEKPSFEFKWNKPTISVPKDSSIFDGGIGNCVVISDCAGDHPARQYVVNRQIPEKYYDRLYYTPDFKELVDHFEPDNEYALRSGDKRLIIPFYSPESGSVVAFQGRTLSGSSLRYITIKVDKDAPKIFGLDTVNPDEKVYILEGPFDSMFLSNAVATAGASVSFKMLHGIFDNMVFVFDNECRKKAIVEAMVKMADEGASVCVWPDTIEEKDVNDMILAGRSPEQIKDIIDNNTYDGLNARISISQWRKC